MPFIPPGGVPPTPNATTTKKGKVKLANELGGTADLPTVAATHSGYAHHLESHTLTSHSTRAHSELTGIGATDHHSNANDHVQSHALDSTTDHSNVAAMTEAKGDVIVFNATTSKWNKLAIGTDTQVLTADSAIADIGIKWAAGGGGGANHAILSATHTDSTAAAVVRGDLIVGIGVTPAWTRLAVGAANSVLWSDGTDPSWSAAPRLANIADTGGTARITLATSAPHLTVTGTVSIAPAAG